MPDQADPRRVIWISDPLPEDLCICGLVRAGILLSSDARDADVMLSLGDLAPGDPPEASRFFRFCDGAVRASYADGWDRIPLAKDEKRPADILLGHVRYTLPKGHRLVAEFSGSAFPKYDINHGTCARPASDPVMMDSTVTLYPENRDRFFLDLPLM